MQLRALCLLLLAIAIHGQEGGIFGLLSSTDDVEGSGQNETDTESVAPDFAKSIGSFMAKQISKMFCPSSRYDKTTNGKLIHDMRTFVNVTFDWSSRPFDPQGSIAIPHCHEERIRKSFYHLFSGAASVLLGLGSIVEGAMSLYDMRTGHLVYPLLLTVDNATAAEPHKIYYAAGVHKVYAYQDQYEYKNKVLKEPMIELLIVTEKTWKMAWNRWRIANKEGKDLCDGGRHFDKLITRINKEKDTQPLYHKDIVHLYTDLTSDVCDASACGCPQNQTETLTFAYPTEEGLAQNITTSTFGMSSSMELRNMTALMLASSNSRMTDSLEACYESEQLKAMKMGQAAAMFGGGGKEAEEYKKNYCIFHPPYC